MSEAPRPTPLAALAPTWPSSRAVVELEHAVREQLWGALGRARSDQLVTAEVALEAPVMSMPAVATLAWEQGREYASYASGCAAVISARSGPDRWTQIRTRAQSLYDRLVGAARPRLFGGFAFDDRPLADTPWRHFDAARFVLPRFQVVSGAKVARLTVCARAEPADIARAIDEARAWLAPVTNTPPIRWHSAAVPMPEAGDSPSRADAYRRRVADIVCSIERGDLDKVVAARRTEVSLSRSPGICAVLARIADHYPDCFRFALPAGSSVLVGAPPELLVRKLGRRVWSEALAGSIANRPGAAGDLLASSKDRAEHDLVVRAIASELRPLCDALSVPPAPGIRSLRHVLHLQSKIAGSLGGDHHIVDLVRGLHPTPAVGGTPRELAVEWIAEREPLPRGWYAAPVGWFDASGDGEFAVAIRSALIDGRCAHLFTGAGIVAGSDPDAELAETELKERAMLEALGVRR